MRPLTPPRRPDGVWRFVLAAGWYVASRLDRIFNFQLFMGIGWRQTRARGPCLVFEFRNHHISNAGTAGENRGINAATFLAGVEWVLRPTR